MASRGFRDSAVLPPCWNNAPADCAIRVFLHGKHPCFPFPFSASEEFPVPTAGGLPPLSGCWAAHLTRLHPPKKAGRGLSEVYPTGFYLNPWDVPIPLLSAANRRARTSLVLATREIFVSLTSASLLQPKYCPDSLPVTLGQHSPG